MIRSRGRAASSATVRIGVGVSCQLVLVLPPPGARTALGLATRRLYSPISFSRVCEELLLRRRRRRRRGCWRRPRVCASRCAPRPGRLVTRTAAGSRGGCRVTRSGCRGRGALASGRCSPPRRGPPPVVSGGVRRGSVWRAARRRRTAPSPAPSPARRLTLGLPLSAGRACRSSVTNAVRSSCGRRSAGAAGGDPAGDVGVAEEGEDLAGGSEHAAALLKRRVDVIEHRCGREAEAVVFEDPGGLVVVRVVSTTGTPG